MTKARDIASATPAPSTVSATELGYLDGVSSAIQTQIDGKQAANANVSTTELGYLDGVTSAIQTQLDAKIPKTLTTTTGDIIYASSANTPARLGIGSTSQVLTVSGGVPTWATPSSGGMTLLSTTSLSGTTTTVSSIDQTYKNLYVLVKDYSASSDFELLVLLNGDTTGSNYMQNVLRGAGNTPAPYSDNSTAGFSTSGYALDANGVNYFCAFTINDYANSTTHKTVLNTNTGLDNGGSLKTATLSIIGYWSTTAISSIGFKTTVGSWGAGTIEIYGVK